MKQEIYYDDEKLFKAYYETRMKSLAKYDEVIAPMYAMIGDLEGKTVLDFGCGFGVYTHKLAQMARGGANCRG